MRVRFLLAWQIINLRNIIIPLHYNSCVTRTKGFSESSTPCSRYEFRFVSLISPSWLDCNSNVLIKTLPESQKFKRVTLKRSYLILSWFYYLSSKFSRMTSSNEKAKSIKLAILPARRKTYTLTKAPMAHKTNSKEQFLFKFYNFKFSVDLLVVSKNILNDRRFTAHCFNLSKNLFSTFETNILLLKYLKLTYPNKGSQFFSKL